MQKSFFTVIAVVFSVVFLPTRSAYSGTYSFGDEPYRLNWGNDPEIQSGCWKWNWQQYGWDNFCPVYVNPKAYMYPRSSRVILPTRG